VQVFHHTFRAMNTRLSLVIPAMPQEAGERLARVIEDFTAAEEERMSRFRPGPLAQINARAAAEPVEVPDRLWTVLMLCRRHYALTQGLFDIALGQFPAVLFDEEDQTIRFAQHGIYLDLGGIGKGVALDGIREILCDSGIDQAFVSFGESSLLAVGDHPAGGPWHIALTDDAAAAFSLRDEALSVSGQGERRHIVDPRCGGWADGPIVMAVAAPSPIEAEVLSTALFIADGDVRASILEHYPDARCTAVSAPAICIKEQDHAQPA
jgi:Membrane-associated lipoprotein involved in thiamine biosynthesis